MKGLIRGRLRALPCAGLMLAGACLAQFPARAENAAFAWIDHDATLQLPQLNQLQIALKTDRIPAASRVPDGVTAPLYGEFEVGPREHKTHIAVLLDEPDGAPHRLFLDVNGNGDLTQTPPIVLKPEAYRDRTDRACTLYSGAGSVMVRYGADLLSLHYNFVRFDPNDAGRTGERTILLCKPDYARSGSLKFGNKIYRAMLEDVLGQGDFRGAGGKPGAGIFLLIDVNGNGKFDERGEIYDSGQPFNIGGLTYELQGITASGDHFQVVHALKSVPEILPPPDLSVGKVVPSFTKQSLSGATIHFPSDYKGKLVLLYFWASWCGDCQREAANVSSVYAHFHPQGLEVLGVSLDHADAKELIAGYTRDHHQPWPQIYDGKWWQAEIAQLYYVRATPTPILVDGSTGKVLAGRNELIGPALFPSIESAMAKRR